MALRALVVSSRRVLTASPRALLAPAMQQQQQRAMSDMFTEKEKGEELIYARHEDEEALKTLLAKIKQREAHGLGQLREVLGNDFDKLSEENIAALLDWKFHNH